MRPDPSSANPLHDYLDAIGLPWRLSRHEMRRRYGVRLNRFGTPVIEFPTSRPFLTGMLWPLEAAAGDEPAPHVPLTDFDSSVYHVADARSNYRLAYRELAPLLGPGEKSPAQNVVGRSWRFGDAVVELVAFPPELQRASGSNAYHEQEPRLVTACHLSISTGYLLPAGDEERAAIAGCQEIHRQFPAPGSMPDYYQRPSLAALEFCRQTEPAFARWAGAIGICAQGTRLVFVNTHLHVVPVADISEIVVARLRKAKGAAGSWLNVVVRRGKRSTASVEVCSADGEDDLNELAERLAALLRVPARLLPYEWNY